MRRITLIPALLTIMLNCSSIPKHAKADPQRIAEIRATVNNRLRLETVLSAKESRVFLDMIVPAHTVTEFGQNCPFIAPVIKEPNDGVYIVQLNCGTTDDSRYYLKAGMLCYPGYYRQGYDDGRYDLSPEPLKTLYDNEYHFFLTSEEVCKQFRQGQKYKGKIYRHKSKSDGITILELNKL